ncbi:MAG: hypothetical protein ACFKPT_15115 [Gloeotrichia echinulata GP01]
MAIIVSQAGFQADYLINSARALYGRADFVGSSDINKFEYLISTINELSISFFWYQYTAKFPQMLYS